MRRFLSSWLFAASADRASSYEHVRDIQAAEDYYTHLILEFDKCEAF